MYANWFKSCGLVLTFGFVPFSRNTVLAVIFFTRVRRESVMSVLLRTHNPSLSPTERGYVVYARFAQDVVWFEVMCSDKLLFICS